MSDFDIELKRRFAELRATDETRAPDFGTMRAAAERAAANTARHHSRWLAIGVIATAAACIALAFLAVQRSRTEARLAEVRWTPDTMFAVRFVSPTDGLLHSARRTIETHTLFESVLDGVTTPLQPTPSKGE